MAEPAVLVHKVPADGAWHEIEYVGDIAHVDLSRPNVVAFWAVPPVEIGHTSLGTGRLLETRYKPAPARTRRAEFRAFRTGEALEPSRYVGSAAGWHLFERRLPDA
jgi:hypothetical protein